MAILVMKEQSQVHIQIKDGEEESRAMKLHRRQDLLLNLLKHHGTPLQDPHVGKSDF